MRLEYSLKCLQSRVVSQWKEWGVMCCIHKVYSQQCGCATDITLYTYYDGRKLVLL